MELGASSRARATRVLVLLVVLGVIVSLVAVGVPGDGLETAAAAGSGFVDDIVFEGLTLPTNIEFSPDGRVYVAEKSGIVKVFNDLNDTTPQVFVDLSGEVHNIVDRGLLGLELHPDFPTTPWVYLSYSYSGRLGHTPEWETGVDDACLGPGNDPEKTECLGSSKIVRFSAPAKVTANQAAVAGSRHDVLWEWCEPNRSHSVGDLQFGPDDALYASHGEAAWGDYVNYGQGAQGRPHNSCGEPNTAAGVLPTLPGAQAGMLVAQDVRTMTDPVGLAGTLIRIDPASGAGVAGNPMIGSPDVNARRIVAYGFRNPFRFTFRPGTTDAYVADVGWKSWEEINRIPTPVDSRADNFGWPCYEGTPRMQGFVDTTVTICQNLVADTNAGSPNGVVAPLSSYAHTAEVAAADVCPDDERPIVNGKQRADASITGLAFYAGTAYPSQYHGALFFADYSRNCLYALPAGAGGVPTANPIEVMPVNGPVDLEAGPGGDLFYVEIFDPDTNEGRVHRIQTGTPTARISATPIAGPVPLTVNFSAAGSADPDGDQLAYAWDLDGDGQFDDASGPTSSRQYGNAAPDGIDVKVRVRDIPDGNEDVATIRVFPGNTPPQVSITGPATTLRWKVGDQIAYSGTGTDPDGVTLHWDFLLHHCPGAASCHTHFMQGSSTATGTIPGPDHEARSYIEARLTATDQHGLSTTVSRNILPREVSLVLRSDPTGVALNLNGTSKPAPLSAIVIAGSTNSVAAPAAAPSGAPFTSWSDGGARTHLVSPATNTTLTATYRSPTNPARTGYWLIELDGDILNFGAAAPLQTVKGELGGAIPVAIAADPAGDGVWVLLSDGRILERGNVVPFGGVNLAQLTKPGERVASLSATPKGDGVWVFTTAGRIIAFGAARPGLEMTGAATVLGLNLDGPIIDSMSTPTGNGAYMVASDGGIFAVGDARFVDSVRGVLTRLNGPPGLPAQPVVGMAPDPDGDGYWVVARDGGVFAFRAPFRGSLPAIVPFDRLVAPVDGMVPYGNGYLLVAGDGGVFNFSNQPFSGSGSGRVDSPVVGLTAFS
jgi:glucose/arabinose dehydrogenase